MDGQSTFKNRAEYSKCAEELKTMLKRRITDIQIPFHWPVLAVELPGYKRPDTVDVESDAKDGDIRWNLLANTENSTLSIINALS